MDNSTKNNLEIPIIKSNFEEKERENDFNIKNTPENNVLMSITSFTEQQKEDIIKIFLSLV